MSQDQSQILSAVVRQRERAWNQAAAEEAARLSAEADLHRLAEAILGAGLPDAVLLTLATAHPGLWRLLAARHEGLAAALRAAHPARRRAGELRGGRPAEDRAEPDAGAALSDISAVDGQPLQAEA